MENKVEEKATEEVEESTVETEENTESEKTEIEELTEKGKELAEKNIKKAKEEASKFKKFICRGNVVDMAVGVIIGSAFSAIVTSLVDDIITPAIGILIGGLDFSALSLQIGDAKIAYGSFIQSIIDFLIIAICIFTVIQLFEKLMHKDKKEAEKAAEPPKKSDEVVLLEEIRDLLKDKHQQEEEKTECIPNQR